MEDLSDIEIIAGGSRKPIQYQGDTGTHLCLVHFSTGSLRECTLFPEPSSKTILPEKNTATPGQESRGKGKNFFFSSLSRGRPRNPQSSIVPYKNLTPHVVIVITTTSREWLAKKCTSTLTVTLSRVRIPA
jgi:hypothetical protein